MIADLVSGGPAAVGIPGGAEKVLDIQQSIVGKIIGKGGETIKGMQSTTGARIQIDQTAWKVTITGAQQAAVDAAAGMIETIANGGDPPQFGAATAAAATGGTMGGYGQCTLDTASHSLTDMVGGIMGDMQVTKAKATGEDTSSSSSLCMEAIVEAGMEQHISKVNAMRRGAHLRAASHHIVSLGRCSAPAASSSSVGAGIGGGCRVADAL